MLFKTLKANKNNKNIHRLYTRCILCFELRLFINEDKTINVYDYLSGNLKRILDFDKYYHLFNTKELFLKKLPETYFINNFNFYIK